MHRLVSFNGVAFPDTGRLFQTNFADLVTQTTRSFGMDGGVDMYDNGRSPSEVGNIRFDFWLEAGSKAHMDDLRETYRAMAYMGKCALIMQPEDQNAATRFTYARVSSCDMSMSIGSNRKDDEFQLVSMTFSVPYPRWFGTLSGSPALWGSGTWGSSYWGTSARQTDAVSSSGTTITLTNNGSAIAYPKFGISDGGSGISNPIRLSRVVSGAVVEYIEYTANVAAGGGVLLDCATHTVDNGTDDGYGSLTATHPEWMRLLPGSNRIYVTYGAGSFSVASLWYDTYY